MRAVKRVIDQAVELLAIFPYAGPEIDRAPEFRAFASGTIPIASAIAFETSKYGLFTSATCGSGLGKDSEQRRMRRFASGQITFIF